MLSLVMILSMVGCDKKEESYRVVKLVEMTGDVKYTRDGETAAVYENMNFENEDKVTTGAESSAKLSLDGDKYLYMAADTSIVMVAEGDDKDSQTTIKLEEGEISNTLQNKLSENSMYEIETSNAVISVTGTTFYVKNDGDKTIVYCEDGEVKITAGDQAESIKASQASIIKNSIIEIISPEDILDEVSDGFINLFDKLKKIKDDMENRNPNWQNLEFMCEEGKQLAGVVGIPSDYQLVAFGNQGPTLDSTYRTAMVLNFVGDDDSTIRLLFSSYSMGIGDYITDGTVPSDLKDFTGTIVELEPVNGGTPCYYLKYSYYDENWDITQTFEGVYVPYEHGCDGKPDYMKLYLDKDFGREMTIEDFQELAYAFFGR